MEISIENNNTINKDLLRDILFKKYFQIEDGVLISDLVDKLSFMPEVWKQLHLLCEENIKYFDSYSSLEKCKLLEHRERNYLILKLRMWRYVIIDIDKMENITQDEFENQFDENFFVNNFNESKEEDSCFYLYQLDKYKGNIKELVHFFVDNLDVLSLSSELYYSLTEDDACTYFYVDFINANAQMGFETKNQYLYEQLFLKYDLTPYGMQDAQHKMGREKMIEIFEKIKDIRIPIECIPNDLYQQYLIQCKSGVNEQEMKKR